MDANTIINHVMPAESTAKDYLTLLKPGVMSLVVFTGAITLWVAPNPMHPLLQCITVLCIALGSGAGGALNMWYDSDIDAQMERTKNRPIPSGRVNRDDARVYGFGLAGASVALLALATNLTAAAWLAFAIFFYAYIYTAILKRNTAQNIVIGGAAGAFPPVIAWAANTGTGWDLLPWLLFGIVFLWTPPHFWALALFRNADYVKVGLPMMPAVAGIPSTTRQMLFYTVLLLIVSVLPSFLGLANWFYGACALLLGAKFLQHAVIVWQAPEDKASKRMFGFSILYLFALFGALGLDFWLSQRWAAFKALQGVIPCL